LDSAQNAHFSFELRDAPRIARVAKDQVLIDHDDVVILAVVDEEDCGHGHVWIRLVDAPGVACQPILHLALLAAPSPPRHRSATSRYSPWVIFAPLDVILPAQFVCHVAESKAYIKEENSRGRETRCNASGTSCAPNGSD